MTAFYIPIFLLFLVELFATCSLNNAATDSCIRQGLWRIGGACIALVIACLLVGQVWLVKIAAPASVAVFLVRVIVRCFDIGVARFSRIVFSGLRKVLANMSAGIVKVAPGLGALLMVFLEALPGALLDVVEPASESMESPDGPASLTNFKHSTGFGTHAFSPRDTWWDES